MRILMSAFSCGPGRGSEPGIGWNTAVEAARLGHEVVVLTQPQFQVDIEQELASAALPSTLRFDIFMPGWLKKLLDFGLRCGPPVLAWQSVNILWQIVALFHVRHRYEPADFDLVHHVSFSGVRYPTLLTRLRLPTAIGPVGGGETAPMALRRDLPWTAWCGELLRDIHTRALRLEPITRLAFRDADVILLRTEESLVAVPPRYRHKACINFGLGIAEIAGTPSQPRRPDEPFRLLYAGRLLHWKGLHLGLRALAAVRACGIDATLTVIGGGAARRRLERLARELDLVPHVTWSGQVSRRQLFAVYGRHHAFLFPSLHDAGGTVILEAWAHGLPVVCLALGGPGAIVDETCGRVVPVAGRSARECVAGLAAAIAILATDEELRQALSRGARERVRQFSWSKVVPALYAEIENRLPQDAGHPLLHPLSPSPPALS